MAKGYDKGRQPRGSAGGAQYTAYGERAESRVSKRLGEIVSDLYLCTDERELRSLWNSAKRALAQTNADKDRIAQVIAQKRIGALAKLVGELTLAEKPTLRSSKPAIPGDQVIGNPLEKDIVESKKTGTSKAFEIEIREVDSSIPADSSSSILPTPPMGLDHSSAPTAVTPDQIKSAMKAFRKRLKLTRLNDESKLGRSPMSSGKKSQVLAIMAPREYPQAVWDELVRQNRLRNTGSGFYELVGE